MVCLFDPTFGTQNFLLRYPIQFDNERNVVIFCGALICVIFCGALIVFVQGISVVLPIENQMTKPQVLNDDNDDDDNGDGDNDDDGDDDDYGDDDDDTDRKPDNQSSVKAVNNLSEVVI